MTIATITQEETITIHNAVQHDLGADPLHVYVLEGKYHTVQVTLLNGGAFNEEWDIEVSTPQYGSTAPFEHVATVKGKRAMWLIVEVFLNEKVDI